MSVPAFTPGPWNVHPMCAVVVPMEHTLRPIGGAEDAAYDLEHYAQEICALHWPDRHRTEAEVSANAGLIAAAPELYEALRSIADTRWDAGAADACIVKIKTIAQMALAKTRGDA